MKPMRQDELLAVKRIARGVVALVIDIGIAIGNAGTENRAVAMRSADNLIEEIDASSGALGGE